MKFQAKVLGFGWDLPAKNHSQSSPIRADFGWIGFANYWAIHKRWGSISCRLSEDTNLAATWINIGVKVLFFEFLDLRVFFGEFSDVFSSQSF